VGVDPGRDLGLDGVGQEATCPVLQDVGQHILARRLWHDADIGGRLAHGGVLLGLVGHRCAL
jgi:hypothetical protein